ncbi:hypothetical protein U1329_03720 [Enterococcus cecorum]|uniref:hypothetical protein n=1 Tax=Enterococcus cecorum TaxID=44008 RepID=UPI002ACAD4E6|nr:hypothetical protein [Enterococcus cecorum]MDZ5439615.1 hypothetical protein [Enterococcus cecorum]MDZ5497666.1 hypothetical protein [Enterococcus cecorum]MDZ5562306.1 hypothetical protein [Enterococcus cecorum]
MNRTNQLMAATLKMSRENGLPVFMFIENEEGLTIGSSADIEKQVPFMIAAYLAGLSNLKEKELLVNTIKKMNDSFETLNSSLRISSNLNISKFENLQ